MDHNLEREALIEAARLQKQRSRTLCEELGLLLASAQRQIAALGALSRRAEQGLIPARRYCGSPGGTAGTGPRFRC